MATPHDQPDRYGGEGLDLDRDRLTLRFESRELEGAFQLDLGSRLGLQYRLGLGLAAGLWVTAGLLLVLIYGLDPAAIAVAVAVPLAVVVGGLALIDRLRSWDAQQVVNGIVNLVGGLAMVFISTRVADVPELMGTVLILNAIFAFSVVRMGFAIGRFDDLAARHGLEKIKTMGDGYLAVAGVPLRVSDHADRAVRFGLDVLRATQALGVEADMPLQLRVGIHSGPLVAGVIGRDKLAYDLWGDTVNVASRMESQGLPGRAQISEATAELLRSGVSLEPRGTIEVRGRGPMRVLLVGAKAADAIEAVGSAEAGESTDGAGLPVAEPASKMTG